MTTLQNLFLIIYILLGTVVFSMGIDSIRRVIMDQDIPEDYGWISPLITAVYFFLILLYKFLYY